MKNYTIHTGISLSEENLKKLQTIAERTGLSRNRVVNLLIANSNIQQHVKTDLGQNKSVVNSAKNQHNASVPVNQ